MSEIDEVPLQSRGWLYPADLDRVHAAVALVKDKTLAEAARFDAFGDLYLETNPAVRHHVHHMARNPDDADDITQEIYRRVWVGLPGFRGDSQFGTWLYRVMRNVSKTQLGRRQRRYEKEGLTLSMDGVNELPDMLTTAGNLTLLAKDIAEQAEQKHESRRIHKALGGLSARGREVIVLHYIDELPYTEIAALLGITENAAKVRAHRAIKRLRQNYSSRIKLIDK